MDKYDLLEKQIDWKNLLLANYKKLNLSEDEVMTILMCQYSIDHNEKTITPELLSIMTNYDIKKSSNLLTSLVNKSLIYLEEDDNGKFVTTLKGIKRILIDDFINNQEDENETTSPIIDLFEIEFGRPLSFAELETIKSWLNNGYSEDLIKNALREAIIHKVLNVRYIDKILLNYSKQEEVKKEGYTTISESWRKDMKESIQTLNEKDK